MDAPKSRYRVVEKDGRLIVIDNATGAPASPPPPAAAGSGKRGTSPSPIAPGRGWIDAAADALLNLVVREWDAEGRAVIAWEWKENGRARRWDARLDAGRQRRLGRALLGVAAAPLAVLLIIFVDASLMWLAALAAPPVVWGVIAIHRLRRETDGEAPPDG